MDPINSVISAITLVLVMVSAYVVTMYHLTVLLRAVDKDDAAGGGNSLLRLWWAMMVYDARKNTTGFVPMVGMCLYIFLWMWVGLMNGG